MDIPRRRAPDQSSLDHEKLGDGRAPSAKSFGGTMAIILARRVIAEGYPTEKMNSRRISIERPVDNRGFYTALLVSAFVTVGYFWFAASSGDHWMAYPLGIAHLAGMIATAFRRPSASVVIEPDTISWFGDGLFWPTSNTVAFIEIKSIELRSSRKGQAILLHNRYSAPWVIKDNCFTDGNAVLSAIRSLRPSLAISGS